jgi:hypothetical protein
MLEPKIKLTLTLCRASHFPCNQLSMPVTTSMVVRAARNARDRLVEEMNEHKGSGAAYNYSCDSCGRTFHNESGRNRHIDSNGDCTIDQEIAEATRLKALQRFNEMEGTTLETQKMAISSPSPIPEQRESLLANGPGKESEAAHPGATRGPGLEESDDGRGRFVERYPGNAGEPISPHTDHRPGLESYIKSCEQMSRPEWFSVAELLTTTKMTDKARTRHLKHDIVSIFKCLTEKHSQIDDSTRGERHGKTAR